MTGATIAPPGRDRRRRRRSRPGGTVRRLRQRRRPGRLRHRVGADGRLHRSSPGPTSVSLSPCSVGLHHRGHDVRLVERAASDRQRRPRPGHAELRRLEPGQRRQPRAQPRATPRRSTPPILPSRPPSSRWPSPATVGWVRARAATPSTRRPPTPASPASGMATVTADVSSLTPGTTALALPKCTTAASVGGVTLHLQERADHRRVGACRRERVRTP